MLARIRSVKPSFHQHAGLYQLGVSSGFGPLLRLGYLGLWSMCDREGRFEWDPLRLKLNILPYDAVDFAALLMVLVRHGYVVRYHVAGRFFGWVVRFTAHQQINPRESASTLPDVPADAIRLAESAALASDFAATYPAQLAARHAPDDAPLDAAATAAQQKRQEFRTAPEQNDVQRAFEAQSQNSALSAAEQKQPDSGSRKSHTDNDLHGPRRVSDASATRGRRTAGKGREGKRRITTTANYLVESDASTAARVGSSSAAAAVGDASPAVHASESPDASELGTRPAQSGAMTSHVAQDAVNGGFASSAGGAGGIVDPEVIQGGPRVVRGSVETTPGGASPSGGTSGESSGESSGGTSGGSALVRQQHGATHALPAVTGPKTADALIGRLSAVMGQVAQRTRRRLAAEQLRRVQGELVFAYWSRMTGHDRALYTPERESRLLARLRENAGDVSELCFTVDGALRDDTIMGRRNDSAGRKYDGIKTVFRDREQVERLMVLARGYAAGKVHPIVAKYLAALEPDDGDGSDALALTAPQEGVA